MTRPFSRLLACIVVVCFTACERSSSPNILPAESKVEVRAGPIFNEAFSANFATLVDGKQIRFRTLPIGDVRITSGRIIACDPLVSCDTPFERAVPIGTFPLHLAIATIGDDERIGLAKIVFGPGTITSWELALTEGQDVNTLKKGEFFGYGVDSGTGGFMDAEAFRIYDAERNRVGEEFDKHLFAELDKTYRHTRSWHLYQTEKGTVAMFSSGYGDGSYATYRAYDAAGNLVALITDFGIIPWE